MGGRYLITGAQIGTIKAMAQKEPQEVLNVINHIYAKQFVTNSDRKVLDDVKKYRAAVENLDTSDELPIRDVPKHKRMASKPGYLVDSYVRLQDIHRAVDGCKKDIILTEMPDHIVEMVLDRLDWWLTTKEVKHNG